MSLQNFSASKPNAEPGGYTRQNGKLEIHEVIGIGEEGRCVNGYDVSGIPYVDKYGHEHPGNNINNYLRPETRARKKV